MRSTLSNQFGAKILISLVLGAGMMAQAQVTGAGPGAGAGATDPTDVDHNMKPMEPGTPPNPKPTDGAIVKDRPTVTLPSRMKRNPKMGASTTTTTVITTTTIGTFR